MDLVVDQLDLDALLGEEALLLGEEQRPVAHPREIEDPQRLGVGAPIGAAPVTQEGG